MTVRSNVLSGPALPKIVARHRCRNKSSLTLRLRAPRQARVGQPNTNAPNTNAPNTNAIDQQVSSAPAAQTMASKELEEGTGSAFLFAIYWFAIPIFVVLASVVVRMQCSVPS